MLYLIGIDFSGDGKGWDNAPAPMIPVNLIKDQGALDLVELRLFDQNGQALPVERFTPSQQLNRATFSTARFSLMASVPNPFNPSTTIRYEVAQTSHIRLSIYNLLGQEVTRLVDAVQATGRYSVVWDGRNSLGQTVASGIYTYRMTTDTGFTDVKRMTLVK
jgi:hypothetical protein